VTYYGGKNLAASFRTVRQNTIQIAEDVPEDQYDFKAAPDVRTIRQTLVHLALSPGLQLHMHQNRIDDLKKVNFAELMQKMGVRESQARTKADVVALLRTEGEAFAAYLESLPEAFLAEQVAMAAGAQPPSKSRFEMLLSTKEHEMHHRGQLMTLQRMIGQKPHLTRQREERSAQQAQAAR
jgi:uncharacterized damage-inducible protein DinB